MRNIADSICVVIPAYMEQNRIGSVVKNVMRYCPSVVVVDDGSSDSTAAEAEKAGAIVLKHPSNLGKGMALHTGFQYAKKQGFKWILTMDADGQHDPEDIPLFIRASEKEDCPLVIGNRMDRPHAMPLVRRLTNKFMSWLLSRQMGVLVPDTQVGFRLYRTDIIPDRVPISPRFAAESEILLRIAETTRQIVSVPIKVIYRDEKSKIRPVRDTIRFFSMLIRYWIEKHVKASGKHR